MNLYEFLESKSNIITKPEEPTIESQIQMICEVQIGSKCSIKRTKDTITVTISKFLTEADVRGMLPHFEQIIGIHSLESWEGIEEGSKKTKLVFRLDK